MDVKQHWNERAALGQRAGTQDLIAKQLEVEAIAKYVKDGQRVLDVGCGNGITAIELARRYAIEIDGIDYAEDMIDAAKRVISATAMKGIVRCWHWDILSNDEWALGDYDLIYTERCLINLDSFEKQAQAIRNIVSLLKPGGLAVFCECSQNGLDRINELRAQVDLEPISPAWHNLYLTEGKMSDLLSSLDSCGDWSWPNYFASTYAYHSRVINAYLAKQEGREPSYDAPVNQMALKLLPLSGYLGQNAIWTWRKR